jgi:Uma2 family endonuclease
MATAIDPANRPDLHYPDSDGQPMSDNTLQFKWIVTIKEGLEALFRKNDDIFVAGDLLWYPEEGMPKIRAAPDVMVAFGRPKGYRGSYKQWEEGGVAPQVVFEILSPSHRFGESVRKFRFYDEHGVEEFYVYDPDRGGLEGWRRANTGLEAIEEMYGYESPRLKVKFEPGEGMDNLKIIGPDGTPFATYVELYEAREAERMRAEVERMRAEAADQRAEAADQRAEAAGQRAERLAARLRELGLDTE